MIETEYSQAAVEVLDILNYTRGEDVEKIPQSFIKFLVDISSENYRVKFNHEQPINKLNLKKQTRELLGFIYITWWCNEEKRKKYKQQIHADKINREEIKEKYNINDMFQSKKENQEHRIAQNKSTIETRMVEYKKENLLKKVLNKILNFFGIKKERN